MDTNKSKSYWQLQYEDDKLRYISEGDPYPEGSLKSTLYNLFCEIDSPEEVTKSRMSFVSNTGAFLSTMLTPG